MTGGNCACPGMGSAPQHSNRYSLRLTDAVSGVVWKVQRIGPSTYTDSSSPLKAHWEPQRLERIPLAGRRWSDHSLGAAWCPNPARFLAAVARSLAVDRPRRARARRQARPASGLHGPLQPRRRAGSWPTSHARAVHRGTGGLCYA